MKEQLKNSIRLLPPLVFSSLMLVVLLCGLSQAAGAEPRSASATMAREKSHLDLLDYQTGVSVCEQTQNIVPNSGFEQGNGTPDYWYEYGPCLFSYDDPGPDSATSAQILASSSGVTDCVLFTLIEDIAVEGGRFYDYSARAKAILLEGEAYLRITFWSWQGDYWNYEGDARTTPVTDTQGGWVKVTGAVQAPPNAERARIYATLSEASVGSAWFDDVFLGLGTCLDISKRDDPDPVLPGQMLTYTVTYSNTGREKATEVWIIEEYDAYVDFVWAQPPPSMSDNLWFIPELPPGDSGTITIVVQVGDEHASWLFNRACILSDETVAPVCTTISTTLPPNGDNCAISSYVPDTEKLGEPGHLVNYDLTLCNAGLCGGQANLLTISQGWAVIIPSPPYTLPSGSCRDVAVSLAVPSDVLSGTVDVTPITATLECESPCSTTVTGTTTLTTTVELVGSVVLTPDHTTNALPGEQVVYTHTLINTANITQLITLTVNSSEDYPLTVEPTTTGSLLPWNGSTVVTVTVHIPGNALSGTKYTTVITATGTVIGQDTISDVTTITTIIVPIGGIKISGPKTGNVSIPYTFTATISPPTATTPITYVWQAPEQSEVITTTGALSHTVTYAWTTAGAHTIIVTVTNGKEVISDTFDITIVIPVQGVRIDGPTRGYVNTPYVFTATVNPPTATTPITFTWSPTLGSGQGSAVVPYIWSTPGAYTVIVTATNGGKPVSANHSISIEWYRVYLPVVLRHWSLIPPEPELYPDNPDGDGDYTVSWSAVDLADFYVLEKTTNSAFTDTIEVCVTPDTHCDISGKGPGRYYYRVKACNSYGCSGWSSVEWTDVLWEQEPNNFCNQANGPLISCLNYYGYHNDYWDCFTIDVHTAGQITVDLAAYGGGGVSLQLRDQNCELVVYDVLPPYHIEYTGTPGQYYICIYTESGHNNDMPYTLHVTFQ